MSITGAVSELDKEISALNKEISRLTQIRESLLKSPAGDSRSPIRTTGETQKRKYVRSAVTPAKKFSTTKKTASVKAAAPVKKRVISAATRKKMSDAAKARAAAKSESAK
jgi:hypothetical protein